MEAAAAAAEAMTVARKCQREWQREQPWCCRGEGKAVGADQPASRGNPRLRRRRPRLLCRAAARLLSRATWPDNWQQGRPLVLMRVPPLDSTQCLSQDAPRGGISTASWGCRSRRRQTRQAARLDPCMRVPPPLARCTMSLRVLRRCKTWAMPWRSVPARQCRARPDAMAHSGRPCPLASCMKRRADVTLSSTWIERTHRSTHARQALRAAGYGSVARRLGLPPLRCRPRVAREPRSSPVSLPPQPWTRCCHPSMVLERRCLLLRTTQRRILCTLRLCLFS